MPPTNDRERDSRQDSRGHPDHGCEAQHMWSPELVEQMRKPAGLVSKVLPTALLRVLVLVWLPILNPKPVNSELNLN